MNRVTKPSTGATTNVTHLQPLMSDIEPEEGWELQSPWGYMRFGDGPHGRLVRLADVVLWLMKAREWP